MSEVLGGVHDTSLNLMGVVPMVGGHPYSAFNVHIAKQII